ncbi:hypothetical protein DFJ58DRAFT_875232 [Suillus subalutaceus]|uniref:uncharacterized protein n=1 Tax=Suillus subalutaceus TaxID=48586 RepID=UPI001B882E39|nr:uncharacterized protein DFJ58DRAFT_875232 [Suillus subalutaceus]KAG1859524.1 hypothetical protein DFJ58DRAFT_875232 [Suillus subalutaceus]
MLRWLSLALVLASNVAALPSPQSKEPSDAPSQCQARAWVRAPDMVPGEVIAGDVKIKLSGPCTGAKSYTLGLRYKEKVFWKLRQLDRREDAPIPEMPKLTYNQTAVSNSDLFRVRPAQNSRSPNYNEAEWRAYENSVQNKDLWSIHEEERIAFEIKSPLVTDPLSTNFTTQFGVLVPNTNYPPGIDCRVGSMSNGGAADMISSESIYEYFVEIGFSNGTDFRDTVNVSLSPLPARSRNTKPSVDRLRSNYTIELSFPEGAHVYQNSSVNFTAIVHRTGYTNRTDIPVGLCAFSASGIEWYSEELQNRSQPFPPFIGALVPSVIPVQHPGFYQVITPYPVPVSPCREIKFAATPAPLIDESHIFSTSSEPLSLSLYVGHNAVPDFSTYYQKLGGRVNLNLHVMPDPSEPWDNEFEKKQWERQIVDADETDWVPWMPPTRNQFLSGDTNILSVIPMQKQGPAQSTPTHYLSDNARQPVFVDPCDIADLRLMLPEERDLIAPLTQPGHQGFSQGRRTSTQIFHWQ